MANEVVTYKLEGVNEIIAALSELNTKETISIIRTVERKALNENIVKPIRAAIPYSASTKKSIKITAVDKDRTSFYAGATSDAFWLRFVEKGTAIRKGRGRINPRPKAIPVIEERPQSIVDFFNKDFGTEIEKILKRKIKKIQK
jgi:hypothetical protein